MKKSEVLQQLQEYLRTGSRTITKLELNLVVAERHIRKLEASENEQEIIVANETIKKLSDEIKELKKSPHAVLNDSERAIEKVLHEITETEPELASVHIGSIKKLEEKWGDQGTEEQRRAFNKYKDRLKKTIPYLEFLKNQLVKDLGIEKILERRKKEGKQF